MNARILRKWSIHTKNLMSCSVCSLVVVVLLMLLLVTCAPSLVLATMNSRSDASFVADPPYIPKIHAIKETTTATSLLVLPSLSSPSSSLLTLPNRNHRLASPRVEVIKNIGNDKKSFPGYYKNYHTDDIQSGTPDYISSSSNSGSRGPTYNKNVQTHRNYHHMGYILNQRGMPRHLTSQVLSSYNDDDDAIKPSLFSDNTDDDGDDNDDDSGDDVFVFDADKKGLGVRNDNNRQQVQVDYPPQHWENPMSSYTNENPNFPVQHYDNSPRRLGDRAHHVAPSFPSLSPTQQPSPALSQQLELINSNEKNPKHTLSTAHNKSVAGEGNDFDIDLSNVNKIKSSNLPIRLIIESYEVPASLPLAGELTEQQRRMLIHEQHLKQLRTKQQQAARSRRESLRGKTRKHEHELPSSSAHTTQGFRKSSSYQHHQHYHNLRQQQQQRMRKHSRRYCSARDPAQLAFEAPTVFEGKIVSMTPDRRSNFSATVEVRDVFKQQIGSRLQKYLRLQFAYRNNSGECDIYREQLRPRGLVRGDTIEPGRIYLLFVQQIDIGNFTILGQPIRKTKRVVEAVRSAVSENYAQLASIKSISASNRTVENGQELRIVCKVAGRPPPKVTWFKDHRSINRNRKLYQFSHYKKRSELIIHSFNTSDAGRYECRAKNKVNRNVERRAIVIKAYPVQRFDPNPRGTGNNCPDDASEFCFNGGTCKFFSEIGSYSCICPEGFIGERCDRKEVNNMPPSTYSNEQECGEKKYLGSYYC